MYGSNKDLLIKCTTSKNLGENKLTVLNYKKLNNFEKMEYINLKLIHQDKKLASYYVILQPP